MVFLETVFIIHSFIPPQKKENLYHQCGRFLDRGWMATCCGFFSCDSSIAGGWPGWGSLPTQLYEPVKKRAGISQLGLCLLPSVLLLPPPQAMAMPPSGNDDGLPCKGRDTGAWPPPQQG